MLSFQKLKEMQAVYIYKGIPCKILANYGETMWIEADSQRYLVPSNEVKVKTL